VQLKMKRWEKDQEKVEKILTKNRPLIEFEIPTLSKPVQKHEKKEEQ
jgi:hypothetical protein